ncbi:MFS transporter [Nocardia sp. NPDC059239]|uniref:MFS transporter n=1 Tax=Nocardia sp. NPDC059239 TaxID=3346785 RepID=UPI00369C9B1E
MAAGAICHIVEWYDFAMYGYFATTIAAVFFPGGSPVTALLTTFTIFAVSFFMRPLGGLFFGRLGDRLVRRPTLLLSLTSMSISILAMGLLPGYSQIGIAAPALLLLWRLAEGFSAGGEYSSANISVIEHAPFKKRGRYASVAPAAGALSALFGPLLAVVVISNTTSDQLASCGWRVPFLAAAPLRWLASTPASELINKFRSFGLEKSSQRLECQNLVVEIAINLIRQLHDAFFRNGKSGKVRRERARSEFCLGILQGGASVTVEARFASQMYS